MAQIGSRAYGVGFGVWVFGSFEASLVAAGEVPLRVEARGKCGL